MKEVVRYQCEFCGKDFRTPNKHQCKYDPSLKNCYTCKHCEGWAKEDLIGGVDVGVGIMDTTMYYPKCSIDYADLSARELSCSGYDLNCPGYENCGGKWFENEHAKQKERELRNEHIEIEF